MRVFELIKSHLLYQLSYAPSHFHRIGQVTPVKGKSPDPYIVIGRFPVHP